MIARISDEGKIQPLEEHLQHTAEFSEAFLASCGFGHTGRLLGLLHDLGKYSPSFQAYIRSVFGLLKEGDPGFLPNADKLRGHIPHAETGMWYLDRCFREIRRVPMPQDMRTLLGMPVFCHHSYPMDVYTPSGETPFLNKKPSDGLDAPALFDRFAPELRQEICGLIETGAMLTEISRFCQMGSPDHFELGLLLRLLYSALIDADRTDAAGRVPRTFQDWPMLASHLEKHLTELPAHHDLNRIRQNISGVLRDAAERPRGIYRLTLPTGSGKTLAGLRFALHHAARHGMKRVIYAAPFLSILEQNAEVFRQFLDDPQGDFVLECHSNILSEQHEGETPYGMLSENWDAPIICTTMVQVLNAMFSGESRYARRFHQFSDTVILLDEIQSLPMEMFHIFNRTVNFLSERMHATVILCSATQPELAGVDAAKGCIRFAESSELYPEYPELFRRLRRVDTEYIPNVKSNEDIAAFAGRVIASEESLLLICNTKPHAAAMFRLLREHHPEMTIFHLSTNLCAAHRRDVLEKIRAAQRKHTKLIVVSTSLIEAGVDISFGAVIRMMTSLDSIVQAAGRCNRNAEAAAGRVYILDNPSGLRSTPSVEKWSVSTGKALRDYAADPARFDSDILSPALLKIYYMDLYAQQENRKLMQYPVQLPECRNETLLNLLGGNENAYSACQQALGSPPAERKPRLRGAFRTAGEKFKALDDLANVAVIVPYDEGRQIIADLCALPSAEKMNALLRRAQMFSVNVTENVQRRLLDAGAIREIRVAEERCIWVAEEASYDRVDLGLCIGAGRLDTNLI
ncbi:MAG: CRISPR-associated helicase Cas3' [Lentisphaeria bacterium]|nr:CRISPR-associated helicase Cas3' [Lentisphaeria bacterium]